MLQSFIRFPEFAELSESSAYLGKTPLTSATTKPNLFRLYVKFYVNSKVVKIL